MTMQPIEILSQLEQYKTLVNHDFTENPYGLKIMLEKTPELVNIYEPKFLEENKNLNLECSECKKHITYGNTLMVEVEGQEINYEKLSSVIEAAAVQCCQGHSELCTGKV
jgi:hypothetical protein